MRASESSSVAAWGDSALSPKTPKYKQTRMWTWGRRTQLGSLSRATKRFHHEVWTWLNYERVSFPSAPKLAQAIALLETSGLDTTNTDKEGEAPIFVLSNGARAGSTLLQRILVTDPRLFLWGEPHGEMALMSRLAEMVSNLEQPEKLGVWANHADLKSTALTQSWIANLYPSVTYFRAALRGLFDEWLGKPARDRGFARWGLKEVRLGASEATLLHWLYPNAKFVIICRHPYDSYKSFADSRWVGYYRYPDLKVDSAAAYAHHWNRLATSWSDLPAGFPCFRMKYEDLVSRKVDFRKLEAWLGIQIKENVALSAPVGGTAKRKFLTWYERMIIAREADAGMRAMGYAKNPRD